MNREQKLIYISVGINFLVGIIIGMVLFYGQIRTDISVFDEVNVTGGVISFGEFLHVSWLDLLWLIFIFLFHNLLPLPFVHPVMMLRGCCTSFCVMYILTFVGIKEAMAAVLPQCFSILPIMIIFSVKVVGKRKNIIESGGEPFTFSRSEALLTILISLIAGGLEVIFYRILS